MQKANSTNWIETGRRHEAKRNAAQWRLIRLQLPIDQTRRAPGSLWHRIRWLSRIRDRQVLRDRLRAYVSG
jgi:hypothetical protein